MIYYTGDIHGDPFWVIRFCKKYKLTEKDVVIILGDVAANYYGDDRDVITKKALGKVKPTVLCIHGNHEMRPSIIPTYLTRKWNGGTVWYEAEYPKLLFAKDGEIYDLEGLKHIAIGGAYSVDKHYRVTRNYGWWSDEQPSDEIKRCVEKKLRENQVDIILTHTCPFKYEPVEMFISGIDQSTVDTSTERWLDQIEESAEYKAWFCGHWHVNKRIDKIHFLFHDFESSEQFER